MTHAPSCKSLLKRANTYSPSLIHHHLFTKVLIFIIGRLERADDDERSVTNTRHTNDSNMQIQNYQYFDVSQEIIFRVGFFSSNLNSNLSAHNTLITNTKISYDHNDHLIHLYRHDHDHPHHHHHYHHHSHHVSIFCSAMKLLNVFVSFSVLLSFLHFANSFVELNLMIEAVSRAADDERFWLFWTT